MKRSAEDVGVHIFFFSVESISRPGQQCQWLKLVDSVQISTESSIYIRNNSVLMPL